MCIRDRLSKVQKLHNEYNSDPEFGDSITDELVVALQVGQKKYGWSEKKLEEMVAA